MFIGGTLALLRETCEFFWAFAWGFAEVPMLMVKAAWENALKLLRH